MSNPTADPSAFTLYWARCAKCNGTGSIPIVGSMTGNTVCDLCLGVGKIYALPNLPELPK